MSAFKIPFWPKKRSNKEYIEQKRKTLRMNRWLRLALGFGALAWAALAVWLLLVGLRPIVALGDLDSTPNHPLAGYHVSAACAIYFSSIGAGIIIGLVFAWAIFKITLAFFIPLRHEKLLVECWDALSDAEKDRLGQKRD